MQGDPWERSISALHDYLIWLRDRGDRSDAKAGQAAESATHAVKGHAVPLWLRERSTPKPRCNPQGDWYIPKTAIQKIDLWERRMLKRWARAGRLTSDGTLRLVDLAPAPWTLERLRGCWPHLGRWDLLGCLYLLDGQITEAEMEEIKEQLREVIDMAVDTRLTQVLGSLLADLRRPGAAVPPAPESGGLTAIGRGRKVLRCRICKEPGHRADGHDSAMVRKAAAAQASEAEGETSAV